MNKVLNAHHFVSITSWVKFITKTLFTVMQCIHFYIRHLSVLLHTLYDLTGRWSPLAENSPFFIFKATLGIIRVFVYSITCYWCCIFVVFFVVAFLMCFEFAWPPPGQEILRLSMIPTEQLYNNIIITTLNFWRSLVLCFSFLIQLSLISFPEWVCSFQFRFYCLQLKISSFKKSLSG